MTEPKLVLSTRSYLIYVNATFNLDLLKSLPKEKFYKKKKTRGRKKKIEPTEELNGDIPEGSIIEKVYLDKDNKEIRKPKSKRGFGNSETIIILLNIDEKIKLSNFKVFRNGTIQMTGIKNIEQAKKTMVYFIENIKDKSIANFDGKKMNLHFVPNLCNMTFNLGFMIDRDRLHRYINRNTKYRSLWTGFGYAAVRIYIPIKDYESSLPVYKMEKGIERKNWKHCTLNYKDFIAEYPKKQKEKNITFHAFHTGNINMTCIDDTIMLKQYKKMIKILLDSKEYIQENLD